MIGEAAANVSGQFRDAHPEIPWREIIGMRNRLIHYYSNVSLDIISSGMCLALSSQNLSRLFGRSCPARSGMLSPFTAAGR